MKPPRRSKDPWDAAEAVFRPAAPTIPEAVKKPAIPNAKETVSLRLDQDVLEAFQADGPGWQDRINAALRAAAGL
ncbi:BrnA antitoxin family protein [Lichenihabitans psoromatis]|uniref:BrnA antitoxin family protein n=1 Tax=Lichenihabitans psoromatis TaxID=2528642 RepID=UPI0010363495|nr:BrnA antitoxin family protein [Lichenihabitans psoromatis]